MTLAPYDGTSNFSTDTDLVKWEVDIMGLVDTENSETTFSALHTQARLEIIDVLQTRFKDELWDADTDAWDYTVIVDAGKLTTASCYWVLAMIHYRLVTDEADVHSWKYKNYMDRYANKISSIQLEFDTDGDGETGDEIKGMGSTRLQRG